MEKKQQKSIEETNSSKAEFEDNLKDDQTKAAMRAQMKAIKAVFAESASGEPSADQKPQLSMDKVISDLFTLPSSPATEDNNFCFKDAPKEAKPKKLESDSGDEELEVATPEIELKAKESLLESEYRYFCARLRPLLASVSGFPLSVFESTADSNLGFSMTDFEDLLASTGAADVDELVEVHLKERGSLLYQPQVLLLQSQTKMDSKDEEDMISLPLEMMTYLLAHEVRFE